MDFTALQDCIKEEVLKGVSQGIEEYKKREVQRISEEHVRDTSTTGLQLGSPEAAAHTSVPAVIPGTAANTRNAPAASPSDGIVDALTRAITAGFSSVHQHQHQRSHQGDGGGAGMLRLTRQGLELCVDPWTGVTEREEELQTRFLVFKSTLLAIFAQEGLTDVVIREVPIRVGPTGGGDGGDDLNSLQESFSADLIERSTKAWNILISSITFMPILTQILAAGSPSEGWKIFCAYYERHAAREKRRLKEEYHKFRMESFESPQSYCDRFAVLRGRLACLGVTFPDPQRHLASNLAPAFTVEKCFLLARDDLKVEDVERAVVNAYERRDVQIQREEDDQDGAEYDPVASGSGRNGRSVQNGGRGNGGRFRRRVRGSGPGRGHQCHQGGRGPSGRASRGQPWSGGGGMHAEHGQPTPPRPPSSGQQQPWSQPISAQQYSSTAIVTQRTISAPCYGGDAGYYSNGDIGNGHPNGYNAYPPNEDTTHGTSNYDYYNDGPAAVQTACQQHQQLHPDAQTHSSSPGGWLLPAGGLHVL